MSTERCCAEEWSSRACKLFKEYTSQANALLFMESETHTDTKLGDLIATMGTLDLVIPDIDR